MKPGPRQIYIYFTVNAPAWPDCMAAMRSAQLELTHQLPGLVTQILRRPDAVDGRYTAMETYVRDVELDAAGVSVEAQALIEAQMQAVTAPFGVGERHAEIFTHHH